MDEVLRVAGGLLLAVGLVDPACANGLALGYAEAAAVRGDSGPADGGPTEEGAAINIRVPLNERWFFTGSAQRLEPYNDIFDNARPAEERKSFGVGARRGARDNEMFARLTYTDIDDWRYFNQGDSGGTVLSVGGRGLFTPYLEATLEGGLGVWNGGKREDKAIFALSGQLALRLVPHLWAYAAYVVDDDARMHAGLRLSFAQAAPPTRRAGVRAAGKPGGPLLAAGNRVIAVRPLQLQVRPAYGAPETVLVPAGAALTLDETRRNEFGSWWRVSWEGQEGWVREGWLRSSE